MHTRGHISFAARPQWGTATLASTTGAVTSSEAMWIFYPLYFPVEHYLSLLKMMMYHIAVEHAGSQERRHD